MRERTSWRAGVRTRKKFADWRVVRSKNDCGAEKSAGLLNWPIHRMKF
jgi:hypothetical protein